MGFGTRWGSRAVILANAGIHLPLGHSDESRNLSSHSSFRRRPESILIRPHSSTARGLTAIAPGADRVRFSAEYSLPASRNQQWVPATCGPCRVTCSLRSSRRRVDVRLDERGAISDECFPNDERVRCVPHPILPGAEEARCRSTPSFRWKSESLLTAQDGFRLPSERRMVWVPASAGKTKR